MSSLSSWDHFNRNVQSGLPEGQFMAAQYTLIAAGPPNLAFLGGEDAATMSAETNGSSGGAIVFPIGVTQRFGVAHTRQHARVWEIGSERSYWISGRTVGQITLGRIVYHGPNLLRVLYAYYQATVENGDQIQSLMGDSAFIATANASRNPHDHIAISPGYQNMFMNLASDLFTQTMGLMIYFKDSNDESVYATYAENCVIPSHSIGFDAGGTVIQENVQIQFERLVPIQLSQVVPVLTFNDVAAHPTGVIATAAGGVQGRATGRNF